MINLRNLIVKYPKEGLIDNLLKINFRQTIYRKNDPFWSILNGRGGKRLRWEIKRLIVLESTEFQFSRGIHI